MVEQGDEARVGALVEDDEAGVDGRLGAVDLDLSGRISSAHGGIRVQFAGLPDVPLTKFTLGLDSGRRGLLVNSADLCQKQSFATAKLAGQNGAGARRRIPLRAHCRAGRRR